MGVVYADVCVRATVRVCVRVSMCVSEKESARDVVLCH